MSSSQVLLVACLPDLPRGDLPSSKTRTGTEPTGAVLMDLSGYVGIGDIFL